MISNIKFGVSTWLWTSPFTTASIDMLFPKIAAMGFDIVEIAVEDPGLIDIFKLKEALQRHNLKATVCGAFGPTKDLTSDDVAIHKNCFSYIEVCLKICAELDTGFFCRAYVFISWKGKNGICRAKKAGMGSCCKESACCL